MLQKKIIFGLGSNLGNRENYLTKAIAALSEKLELTNVKKSQYFANKALLKPNAPAEWNLEFLNIAVSANINLQKFSPEKILTITQAIEKEIGRQSNKNKVLWAPREIDIDILTIESLIINLGEKLKIPHHALLERNFFLIPLLEIEPNWQYPS